MADPLSSTVSIDLVGSSGSKHPGKGDFKTTFRGGAWGCITSVSWNHGNASCPGGRAALPMLIYGKGAQPSISPSTSTISDLSSWSTR